MAPQTDRTEAGEAHGKSRHLEDIRRGRITSFSEIFEVACRYSLIFSTPSLGHEWTWIVLAFFFFVLIFTLVFFLLAK